MPGSARRQILIAGLTLALVVAVVLVTSRPTTSKDVPAAGGQYVEGVVGHPTYLNPLLATLDDVDSDVTALTFSGLTRLDSTGQPVPDLATSWTISPDGLTYTFQLRDATWQDGQPLTAADVVFTINQIQAPGFPGSPDLVRSWQSIKVAAPDAHTVQFTLNEPMASFLESTTLGVVPAHALRATNGKALLASQFNAQPIGSGPFAVKDASLREVDLVPNPYYYGKPPYLAGITFRYFATFSDALDALQRGDIQGVGGIPPDQVLGLANNQRVNLVQQPEYAKLSLLVLNTQGTFFGDDVVRRAIDLAIDRAQIIQVGASGEGVPAGGPIAPNSWAYLAQSGAYTYDPAQAAKLLDQAGWRAPSAGKIRQKDGKPFHFVLLAVNQPDRQRVADEISRELRAVGLDAQVQTSAWTGIVQDYLVPRSFDAVLTEAYSPTADPDPYAFWDSSQAKTGLNVAGWSNRVADQLLEDARHQTDRSARQADYAKFQALFAQEQPSILLYHPLYAYAVPVSLKAMTLGVILQPSDRFQNVADWYVRTRTESQAP